MPLTQPNAAPPPGFLDKFLARVDVRSDPDACWPWTGALDKDGKYGVIKGYPHSRFAHRIAYMIKYNRVLPRDIVVHHTCHERPDHTPLCCNPRHLEPVDDATHRSQHARARWEADKAGRKPFRKARGMGIRKGE